MVEALRIAAGDPAWTNGDLEDVSGRLESEVTPAKVDAAFCVPWIDPSDGTVFIGELNVMDEAQMNLFRPGSHEVITKIRFSEWMAAPGTLLMLSLNLSLASRILGSSDDDATFVLALAITWAAATGCTWFTMNPLSDVGKHFRKKQKYKDGDEKTPMSDTAIFKSSKWPTLLDRALVLLNRGATAILARRHCLGNFARSDKNEATTDVSDKLIQRAAGTIGLNVQTTSDRSRWYHVTKVINYMAIVQLQLAFHDYEGKPRKPAAAQTKITVQSSERALKSLLYVGGVYANLSHRTSSNLQVVELVKDELPRRLNGPTGTRSLLEALTTAMYLRRIGATLFAPSLEQTASELVEGTVDLLPFAHLTHPRLAHTMSQTVPDVFTKLNSTVVDIARGCVKMIRAFNIGFSIAEEGLESYFPSPGDAEILDKHQVTYELGGEIGQLYRHQKVTEDVANLILTVVQTNRPAVTAGMSHAEVMKVWETHADIFTNNKLPWR